MYQVFETMRRVGGNSQQAVANNSSPNQKAGLLDSFTDNEDTLGLSFYDEAPQVELSLSDFQEHACARLKVLHAVDRHCGYDFVLAGIGEKRMGIEKELADNKLLLKFTANTQRYTEERTAFLRRDTISHFIMRLAFCKTRDSRDWLMKQEQRLFALRFESLQQKAKERFIADSGLQVKKFENGSGGLTVSELGYVTAGAKIWGNSSSGPTYETNFYELAFHDVHPSLIARRAVVIEGGRAYVPSSALTLIIAGRFKEKLSAALDVACRGLPRALSDPQVGRFLKLLQDNGMQLLVGKASSSPGDPEEKLSLATFEEVFPRSLPPCMRALVQYQRETKKHLKHAGRLQLRPFLKDAGFTYEESHEFWRRELSRDPTVDGIAYEKNYAYDIDHAYKKKGGHQGQNPFGCAKLINFPNPAPGQLHGCPFRHLEMRNLKQMLYTWKIPEDRISKIEKLVTNGKHFQIACIEYFEAMHPGSTGDGVGNHPNTFFNESSKYHIARKKKEEEAAAARGTVSTTVGGS
jgi:DNA primase large subunit